MPRPGNASIDSDVEKKKKKIPRGVKGNLFPLHSKPARALSQAAAGLTRNGYANRKMTLCRHVGAGETAKEKNEKKKRAQFWLLEQHNLGVS